MIRLKIRVSSSLKSTRAHLLWESSFPYQSVPVRMLTAVSVVIDVC